MVNEKTKHDENLYYKGVDKHLVDPARLSQMHGLDGGQAEDGTSPGSLVNDTSTTASTTSSQPPYLFKSGDTLLAMTRQHNVRNTPSFPASSG